MLVGFRSCQLVVSCVNLCLVHTKEKRGYPKTIIIRYRLPKSHKGLTRNLQKVFIDLVDKFARWSTSKMLSQSCSNGLQLLLQLLGEPAYNHGADNSFEFTIPRCKIAVATNIFTFCGTFSVLKCSVLPLLPDMNGLNETSRRCSFIEYTCHYGDVLLSG